MRIFKIEQLALGTLIKCVCSNTASVNPFPKKGYWLGIVFETNLDGVHVHYEDGDRWFYYNDGDFYEENLYLLKEERTCEY